ncbi:MAG: DUF6252 family protein [Bacteroidales bacterium]|nr:DUF6252 family protein [Bacteroidales bacterium]
MLKKPNFKNFLLYGAFFFIMYSCTIDEGGNAGPPGADSVTEGIEAKVDNTPWKAFNYSGYLCGKQLTITGLDSALGNITLTINDTIIGKTYELNSSSSHWATYIPSNSTDIYTTYSNLYAGGIVYLSSFSKDSLVASGSFIFYVYNNRTKKTITISSGGFTNVSYTKENYPSSGIRAYIGGKLWTSSISKGKISNEFITIESENTKGEKLYFKICSRFKGTYALNSNNCNIAMYYTASNDTIPYLSSDSPVVDGKMVVTEITSDSLAQGSFICLLYRASDKKFVQITQGVFNGIKLSR